MPGCTMRDLCTQHQYMMTPVCNIFSTYKEICGFDMPMMANCSTYNQMCNSTSVIQQCAAPIVTLPNTMDTNSAIKSICGEMAMDGCAECIGNPSCDLLTTYSKLCIAMPDMSQCAAWKTMCASGGIAEWPLCSSKSNSDPIPIMRMYFHTGELDYILFKEWVPTSRGYYVGSWFVIVVMGIFFEFTKLIRSRIELKCRAINGGIQINKYEGVAASEIKIFDFSTPINFKIDILRAFMHFFEYGLGLLLMLIAMTFNVGLFIAVVVGALLGNLLFGRYHHDIEKASCC